MSSSSGLAGILNLGAGKAQLSSGQSISTLLASLGYSLVVFAAQVIIFLLIKDRIKRIYQPRTYLVPERELITAPCSGPYQWLVSAFRTSNHDFIQKCGLDAYFFLRYLRTLLKIFVPLAFVVIPVLVPINAVGGRGSEFATGIYGSNSSNSTTPYTNVTGLDQLAWGNVMPNQTNRYWAHLIMAVFVVTYVCWVFYDELRGYVRVRQAYLSSPQHRLRASATTVLVTSIPAKWCTLEALAGLYDVFPGGVRNIWINRKLDELNDKVTIRDKLAKALEQAETQLIRDANKAHLKELKRKAKKSGADKSEVNEAMRRNPNQPGKGVGDRGVSVNNPHQIKYTLDEALDGNSGKSSRASSPERDRKKSFIPIPIISQGIGAVGNGIGTVGRNVLGGLRRVGEEFEGHRNHVGGPSMDGSRDSTAIEEPVTVDSDHEIRSNETTFDSNVAEDTSGRNSGLQLEVSSTTHPENIETISTTNLQAEQHEQPVPGNSSSFAGTPTGDLGIKRNMTFWKQRTRLYDVPSPQPHTKDNNEYPFFRSPSPDPDSQPVLKDSKKETKPEYPQAYDPRFDKDGGRDDKPKWALYLKENNRPTMTLPLAKWLPAVPFIGKKVDTIYYCRKHLARLNAEIEEDQAHPEKFPLMKSAFIQFNNQVAAHMACQSLSHHAPNTMAPRIVEVSPDDVIWDNMSIGGVSRYIRTAVVIAAICGMVVLWAFPVFITGQISQIDYLANAFRWLGWLKNTPHWLQSAIQGILPVLLLQLLLLLLPLLLRFLARAQGLQTGTLVELAVQNYFFAFLFVQVFLVVSISTGIATVLGQLVHNPQGIPSLLATNLPKAANYFFSYFILQGFSISSSALLQVFTLLIWLLWRPLRDNTARARWQRSINLAQVQWGTFFPVYTNLATIGIIYSVFAPIVLIFNIITFGLFWIVYRYNTLYVTRIRLDTGGLLFPKAINQLFTGLYVMELCLIGLFFLARNADPEGIPIGQPCAPQATVMIVVLVITFFYQLLLNREFAPLVQYLPITLEDDAVKRDDEFRLAQEERWRLADQVEDDEDINEALEKRERRSEEHDREVEQIELEGLDGQNERNRLDPRNLGAMIPRAIGNIIPKRGSWADRSRNTQVTDPTTTRPRKHHHHSKLRQKANLNALEAQLDPTTTYEDNLFVGISDTLEDLTPAERDKLVQRAFQHQALRAVRPAIWLPRDPLGVSTDEIEQTQRLTSYIWIENRNARLDEKGRAVPERSPPDFTELKLIQL